MTDPGGRFRPGFLVRNLLRQKALIPLKARVAPKERTMDGDTADRIDSDQDEKSRIEKEKDRALDKALEETFPGSDPVNVTQPPKSKQERRNEQSPTSGGRTA